MGVEVLEGFFYPLNCEELMVAELVVSVLRWMWILDVIVGNIDTFNCSEKTMRK